MFDCCEIYILIYGIPGVDDLFNRFGTFRQMLKLFLQFDQCDFVLKLGGGGGLIYEWKKNAMDAHRSRLLGDGSFGHPRQMLKWMDVRVSCVI